MVSASAGGGAPWPKRHASPRPTTACPRTRQHVAPPLRVTKVIPIRHARAEEVASTLRSLDRGRAPLFHRRVIVRAYHHRNALVLVGTPRDLQVMRKLVRELNLPRKTYRERRTAASGRASVQ